MNKFFLDIYAEKWSITGGNINHRYTLATLVESYALATRRKDNLMGMRYRLRPRKWLVAGEPGRHPRFIKGTQKSVKTDKNITHSLSFTWVAVIIGAALNFNEETPAKYYSGKINSYL